MTAPQLQVGDERESRVLHSTHHRIGWWVAPFGRVRGWALGAAERSLLEPCNQTESLRVHVQPLTESLRVTEGGRSRPRHPPSASRGVSMAGHGPPHAQGDIAKLKSL